MLPKVAAVTMAYNEAGLLPVWARHYARQVGSDHCYVVDHGSTDTITLPPGMNKVRLPRSPHDDERRAGFISTFVSGLLRYYDWVIYTDVDELVLSDPSRFADLPNFCASLDRVDTVTTAGFDVQHVPDLELPLDLARPIGEQRGWVRFTSAMCKPVLTRRPLSWSPGFHCSNQPLAFAGLYLFHLHWADLTLGLQRLQKTRQMPWINDEFGAHQRVSESRWVEVFQGMAGFPRRALQLFETDAAPLTEWLAKTIESSGTRSGQTFSIDLGINAPELWAIPPHFRRRL